MPHIAKRGASKAHLNVTNDFGKLDHEISCESNLNQQGFQYEIWDYNHNEAITVGLVWLFRMHINIILSKIGYYKTIYFAIYYIMRIYI